MGVRFIGKAKGENYVTLARQSYTKGLKRNPAESGGTHAYKHHTQNSTTQYTHIGRQIR